MTYCIKIEVDAATRLEAIEWLESKIAAIKHGGWADRAEGGGGGGGLSFGVYIGPRKFTLSVERDGFEEIRNGLHEMARLNNSERAAALARIADEISSR